MAAHLARRAGFGATEPQLAALVEMGREAAVSHFVDFPLDDTSLSDAIRDAGGDLSVIEFGTDAMENESTNDVVQRVRRWWLYRMVQGNHPLQEKLTLLWHDHFACQQSKILRLEQYLGQNKMFRRNAAGSFRTLVTRVAEDPGMLTYLDNRLNETANPNENWSRELLELFTLGVDNGYDQQDVWELARVFTGWTTPDLNTAEFIFRPELHDATDKVLFGRPIKGRAGPEGVQEGYEALERILDRPECATFLAFKLLGWFVTHEPSAADAERYGQIMRQHDGSIREALRAMFLSDAFYDELEGAPFYRNPVEFVVSAARLLEIQNTHVFALNHHTRLMGMDLFEPPSVAGWEHGEIWVNSSSTVHRFNYALDLSDLPHSRRTVAGRTVLNLDALAGAEGDDDMPHAELVDRLSRRLFQREIPSREAVIAFLDDADSWLEAGSSPRSKRRAKTRAAVHLLLTSPEFALA